MPRLLSRRRFIGITAAAAGLSVLPLGYRARAEANLVTWQGHAMGAVASLQIHHQDRATAERLVTRAIAEVRRLEEIFSLYRDDSALVTLNRHGILVAPPSDLVAVLAECRRAWHLTGGAFDPTVQALWTLYWNHFSKADADPQGPAPQALQAALADVGFDRVTFDADRIALPRRGMGLTLNGIAQGYATDRVTDILRAEGVEHTLVDMGEPRVLGARPSGEPWRVGIADPDNPSKLGDVFYVMDKAVASSGGYGFTFDSAGRFNHLLSPKTGRSAQLYRSVTVVLPQATPADALSTAFSFLTEDEIANALKRAGGGEVRLITAEGTKRTLSA